MKNLITYLKALWSWVSGSQRKKIGVTLGEATIEHPFSTYSAPFGTCWQPSGKLHSVVRCAAMLVMLFTIGSGNVWGEEKTITLTHSSFSLTTTYAKKTATVSSIGFTVDQGYKGTGNVIQMNSSKGSGILYNTTAIKGLKSIEVTVSSGNKTYTITTGTSEKPTANSQTGTTTKTFNAKSGDTYFQLKVSGASYFSKIVITYDDAATFSVTVKSPTGRGTYTDVSVTDKTKMFASGGVAFSQVVAKHKACTWSDSYMEAWNNAYVDYEISKANKVSTKPTNSGTKHIYTTEAGLPSSGTLYPLFIYGGYYYTEATCPTLFVNYDSNGATSGTAPSDGNNYDPGDEVTVLGQGTLTRTNYTFTGWNTESDGSGTHYDENDHFDMPDEDVTLYAEWCKDLSKSSITVNEPTLTSYNSGTGKWTVNVTWTAVDGATYYTVQCGDRATSTVVLSETNVGNVTSYSISNLTNAHEHRIIVTAKHACDATQKQGKVDFTPTCDKDVSAVTPTVNATTSITKTGATANWVAVSDADHYTVKVYQGTTVAGDPVKTYDNVTSTSQAITGLTANTDYIITVQAHDACGHNSVVGSGGQFKTQNLTLYTVTFHNAAGSAPSAVTQTTENGTVSIPSASACDGWDFAGWKVGSSQSSTTSDPTGSGYITSESWPKTDYVPSGNITVHAVFKKTTGGSAKTTLLTSTFDDPSDYKDEANWPTQDATYAETVDGVDVLRFSAKSGTGSITSKSLTAPIGTTVKVAFKIKDYGDSGTEATVSLSNCATEQTFATSSYTSLTDVEKSFTTTSTTSFTVTICANANKKRFYITDIEVYYGGGGTTTWKSDVSCSSATLDHISITTNPTKLNYLVGDVFDPTGAVVEAYYDDDSHHTVTGDVTWTAPTGGLTAGTNQTMTASYTEGGVTRTDSKNVVNVYAVTLLKKDETGTAISGLLSDAPAVSLTLVNHLTAAETGAKYTFKEWQVTNGSLSSTSSLTPTIDAVSGAITVTAVYYKPITVTWHVPSGVFSGPSDYSRGWATQFPDPSPDPEDYGCDGKIFYGWTRSSSYNDDDTPPTLVTSGEALTSDEDFYAVFAIQEGAGTPPTWAVTSFGSVTAGTYLIALSNKKVFNGEISSGHGQVTAGAFTSALSGSFSEAAPVGACELTLSTNSSGWNMYNADLGYLYCTGSSSGHLAWNASAQDYWFNNSSSWRYHGAANGSGVYVALSDYGTSVRTYTSPTNIVLLKKTAAGSPATYSEFSTSCTCKGFSFHTGSGTDNEVKATNTRTCFEQVESSTTWKIDNYVIPSDAKFFVGYQDEFKGTSGQLGTSSKSVVTQFDADEAMYFEYTKTYGDGYRPSVGNATGAVGTLRIWSDNSWNNCHVGFDPNGYIFKLGSTYYTMSNSATLDGARYKETEVITLTSTDISGQFQVNIAAVAPNASTGVASRYTEAKNLTTMGVKSGSDSWRGTSINNAADANTKGFFRIDKGEGNATNWNAHWVPVWEITFDLKGGTGTIATTPAYVSVEAASKVVQIPTTAPTKDGYRFMGWSDTDGGGVNYAAGSTHNVTLSGNKTVYAVWAQEYTVTYAANGGTTSCTEPNHIAGETVTVCASEPSKACSTFLGWLGDNGIGTKAASSTFTMPAANVTLTAQWNTTQYAITYKDQGDVAYSGSNSGSLPANHTCGSATVLPNGVRDGYRFDGWFDNSACTGSAITSLAAEAVGPFTLYAKWTASLTFTFSKNGVVDGTLTLGQVEGGNVVMPNTTVDCGLWTTFEGWVIGDVAETTTEPATIYKPGDIYVAGSTNQEFKAVYSKHEGDGTVTYVQVTSNSVTPAGEYVIACPDGGKILTGLNGNKRGTYEAVTISDGVISSKGNGVVINVNKKGSHFNIKMSGDTKYITTCNDTYFEYSVTDGASACMWELTSEGYIHSTDHTTRYLEFLKSGTQYFGAYTGTQWKSFLFRKKVAGTTYYTTAPGTCVVPTEITVSYNDNKSHAGDQTISGMPSGTTLTFTSYPNFDSYTIGSAPTDPTGYHFTGWNTSADGNGDDYAAGASVTTFGYTETITLYAQWERVYSVTLYDNGVERTTLVEASAGAGVTLPSGNNCTPGSAFTFEGWTESAVELNADPVRPATLHAAGSYAPTSDITLYSVYSKSVAGCDDFAAGVSGAYKMYYDGSKYATTAGTSGSYTGATSGTAEVFYIAYAPAHTGYTIRTSTGFVGWNYDGSELTKANATPYYWKISGNSSNWVITPEPSAYTKQLKSTDGSKFQLYASGTSGKLLLQKSAMTYYYNTAICEENSITFHDGGGTISGTPTIPTGASWNSGTHVLSGLEDCDKITTFPTASYDGWTFIGWSTEDYSNSGKHTTDHPEENAGTDEPDGSEIYKTDGNPYVVRGGSIDLYPIFTRFPDNEPFNTESGGDYYIYYLKPGTDDGYGANIRVYAGEYDGEKRYSQTTSCAAATEFTFTKDGDVWHIYDKTTSKYVTGLSTQDWLLHANDLSGSLDDWTITIKSGNQFYASCQGGGRYISFSTSANYFMDYSTTANPGICLPVYLGSCTERIFSSEPNPTPTIDLTGEPMVTSSVGQQVRATETMTLSASHLGSVPANKIIVSGTNLKFATTASATPSTTLSLSLTEGNLAATTIYVYYTPTATEDGLENIVVTAKAYYTTTPKDVQTTGIVHARHLPADFVIAAKWGDKWYALPNTCAGEGSNTAGVLIEVNDANAPTAATAAPHTAKWGMRQTKAGSRSDGSYNDRLVFTERTTATANDQKTLYNYNKAEVFTNATYTNYNNANPERYEWIPVTTDFGDYELTSANNVDHHLILRNSDGLFVAQNSDKSYDGKVRLLPATFYEEAPVQIVEWKANSVVVMYTGTETSATTKVGTNSASSVQTLSTHKLTHGIYELTTGQSMSIGTNTNKNLLLTFGSTKKVFEIPVIITGSTNASSGYDKQDVIITKTGKLTAQSTKYSYRNIYVYGGGKLKIASGMSLGVNNIILRAGGITTSGIGSSPSATYEYIYPQVELRGTLSSTKTNIKYEYITDYDHWYHLVLPFDGTLNTITYPTEYYGDNVKGNNTGSWIIKRYAGEIRATGNYDAWKDIETEGATSVTAGHGYIYWGAPKKLTIGGVKARQAWGIQRITMPVTAAAAMTAENADKVVGGLGSYSGVSGNSSQDNDQGWNLIGDPYLTNITNLSGTGMHTCKLVEVLDANDNWTGRWEWNDETSIRYLTIPDHHFDNYTAKTIPVAVGAGDLNTGHTFFVQIEGEATGVTFEQANRASLMPALYAKVEESVDIETGVVLSDETKHDEVNFWIKDGKTAEYEYNADYPKTPNSSNFNLYGVHSHGDLSWIAISPEIAEGSMAIGYQVPTAGEYRLSLSETYVSDKIEQLLVTDHEMSPEITTNLLVEDYLFQVNQAETNNERFTVSIKIKSGTNTATDIDDIRDVSDQPKKFLYRDKMYILRGGKIYDATGKQVREIK